MERPQDAAMNAKETIRKASSHHNCSNGTGKTELMEILKTGFREMGLVSDEAKETYLYIYISL